MFPVINEISALDMNSDTFLESASVEEQLKSVFSHHLGADYADKVSVINGINNSDLNIENLYQYQLKASEYNIKLSLYAALARKAVTAVDTLIRA